MKARFRIVPTLLFAFAADTASARPALSRQIAAIAANAHGKVAVACSLPGSTLKCDLHPKTRPPMQSVFKLPLVVTLLHQVEQGHFTLDQPIRFLPSDRILPTAYSPLQDQYPAAGVDVPLRRLLELTVSVSDNAASEVLLRIAGGPAAVEGYIASLGVAGFHLRDGEKALHHNSALQYRNWWQPRSTVQFLRLLADHSPLTPDHTTLLLGWMRPATPTKRLQANLPPGTAVAHKSGTSDVDHGLAHATNDIGLISLPDGRLLALAVFVTDATADTDTREQVIARISRAVYDAAVSRP